jgi:hypothetical protein
VSNWKVTALLSSPIAGDVPYLDSIIELQMAFCQNKARPILRCEPAPPVGGIHIPCLRGDIGGVKGIPRCSAPIAVELDSRHEHIAKRIGVEHAGLLSEAQRLSVATGNSWTKSYRLPLKVSNVDRVVWFVGGSKRRHLKSLLERVKSLGKKRSDGYGRVSCWGFDEVEHDYSWFAPAEGGGTLLMRVLPHSSDLPSDLVGFKRWFGGFAPPYWHPDRFLDVVVPC